VSSDEPEAGTLERHYRVTLDFRLLIREVTPELCRESFFFNEEQYGTGGADFKEIVGRQRRLYALLRKNRRVFERYLLSVLTQEAGSFVHDGLAEAFDAWDEPYSDGVPGGVGRCGGGGDEPDGGGRREEGGGGGADEDVDDQEARLTGLKRNRERGDEVRGGKREAID
jgi:hypothetical protein